MPSVGRVINCDPPLVGCISACMARNVQVLTRKSRKWLMFGRLSGQKHEFAVADKHKCERAEANIDSMVMRRKRISFSNTGFHRGEGY